MKQAAILGERRAGLIELPDPRPKEDWVVVKVHAAPMCTEYKAFLGGRPNEFLGHEAAGEVVEVAQPGRVRVGDTLWSAEGPDTPAGARVTVTGSKGTVLVVE